MDIISFNEAATANSRIEICNANPDSTSGIVTVPKVIASGETITIPSGRVAILPNVQIDGTLNVEGEVFIPSGATFSGVVEKVTSTDNAIVRFNGITGAVQNSSVVIDDNGNLLLTSGTGGVGYGTGSGGTVTQLTNKNFNVSLNKPTGTITTSNSVLVAGQGTSFAFLNSLLSINDNLKLTPKNTINYDIDVIDIYNGAASIRIINKDSISHSDAISINFSIEKGAIS